MNQQSAPKKKINEIRMSVWVGVVAIIVICLLTLVYMVFVGRKESGNQNNNININTAIDISDWLTYTDSQYGFSFKYPSDWTLIEEDIIGLSFEDNYYIYITHQGRNPDQLSIAGWLKTVKGLPEDYGYELKYDKTTGISLKGLDPGIYQGAVTLYIMNNNDVFGIEWFDSEKKNEEVFKIFNAILLSFEFTKTIGTSNWLTYESGRVEIITSEALSYWKGKCKHLFLIEESVSEIICNGDYCLMQVHCMPEASRFVKYENGVFTDMSDEMPMDGNYIFYEWNGDYWLISDVLNIFKFDGANFEKSDLSIDECEQILALDWNDNRWLVGIKNKCANHSRLVSLAAGDLEFIDEIIIEDLYVTEIAWNGIKWMVGGYKDVLINENGGNNFKRIPRLLTYDGSEIKDFSDNLKDHIAKTPSSIFWNGSEWLIALKHAADNEDGIIYAFDGNEFYDISETIVDYDRNEIRLITGRDDLYVILSGDQNYSKSKIYIIKEGKLVDVPSSISTDIFSVFVQGNKIFVGGLQELQVIHMDN